MSRPIPTRQETAREEPASSEGSGHLPRKARLGPERLEEAPLLGTCSGGADAVMEPLDLLMGVRVRSQRGRPEPGTGERESDWREDLRPPQHSLGRSPMQAWESQERGLGHRNGALSFLTRKTDGGLSGWCGSLPSRSVPEGVLLAIPLNSQQNLAITF